MTYYAIIIYIYKYIFLSYVVFPDEVGALVFDIGSYTSRAGYAGEDTPKVLLSVVFYIY